MLLTLRARDKNKKEEELKYLINQKIKKENHNRNIMIPVHLDICDLFKLNIKR
jgi:hypothetical protein